MRSHTVMLPGLQPSMSRRTRTQALKLRFYSRAIDHGPSALNHQPVNHLIDADALGLGFEVADDTVTQHGFGDRLDVFDIG